MADFWTYFGIILALLSILVGYLSHSHVLKKAASAPNTILAKAISAMFGSTDVDSHYERNISLRRIIQDKRYLERAAALTDLVYVHKIVGWVEGVIAEGEGDPYIQLSEVVIRKLKARSISFTDFIADIFLEMNAHFVFLERENEYRDAYFPLRSGLIVMVTKDSLAFCCNDLRDSNVAKDHVDAWRRAPGFYYVSLEMPVRHIRDFTKLQLVSSDEFMACYEIVANLVGVMSEYVEGVLADPNIEQSKKDNVFLHKRTLNDAWSGIVTTFRPSGDNDLRVRRFLVASETIISTSHKVLLGSMEVTQGQIIQSYYAITGRRVRAITHRSLRRLNA